MKSSQLIFHQLLLDDDEWSDSIDTISKIKLVLIKKKNVSLSSF